MRTTCLGSSVSYHLSKKLIKKWLAKGANNLPLNSNIYKLTHSVFVVNPLQPCPSITYQQFSAYLVSLRNSLMQKAAIYLTITNYCQLIKQLAIKTNMVTILHGWSFISKCGASRHSILFACMGERSNYCSSFFWKGKFYLIGWKFGVRTYLSVTQRKALQVACILKGSKFLSALCTWKKYGGENHGIKLWAADSLKNCPNWEWDCEAQLTVARTLKGLALNLLIPYYGENLQCLWPCKISLSPADF